MTKGVIGWDNIVQADTTTVTAGVEATSFPATNVQNDQGAYVWLTPGVTTSAAGAYLDIDAGSAVAWQHFLLARTNLTPSAQVRILLGATQGASDVYDSGVLTGVVAGYLQLCHVAAAVQTARWCRIKIDDPTNPDGHIAVGLVWAGQAWTPTRNWSYGTSLSRTNSSDETTTRGGQEFPVTFWSRRCWDVRFNAQSRDNVHPYIYELDRVSRLGGNVLFIPDPAGVYLQREALLGRFKPTQAIAIIKHPVVTFAFHIEERL
jgi:hypothetical protein